MTPPLDGVWLLEPLTANHDVANFASGEPEADEHLRQEARRRAQSGGTATHVLVVQGSPKVEGFFTLVGHQIIRNQLPNRDTRGKNYRKEVQATLLAWMALSKEHRGKGLGLHLLLQAFRVAVEAAGLVDSVVLVLDALNDRLLAWYQNLGLGLRPLKDEERPRRLYITMDELRRLHIARPEPPAN